jgi:hypothetical protein
MAGRGRGVPFHDETPPFSVHFLFCGVFLKKGFDGIGGGI